MTTVRIVGDGRAGRSLEAALSATSWESLGILDHDAVDGLRPDFTNASAEADIVVLAVPDDAIADVAQALSPGTAAILHLSGATRLDALSPHTRVGSVHPLVSLPNLRIGAERLLANATFAVAGDPAAGRLVAALGGRAITVDDDRRATYHAAASVAANHLVALAAQVSRLATAAGVPDDAFWDLMSSTLDNVRALGPQAALTGPAARGDVQTVANHVEAIDPAELQTYLVLADEAARLAGRTPLSTALGEWTSPDSGASSDT